MISFPAMLCGYHLSSEIFGYCQFFHVYPNWISQVQKLNFNFDGVNILLFKLTYNITECQPEPSGWNPVGALVSGASHYLCVVSQGCRRWVPVSKTAMSLSQIESDDKNSGLCVTLWKQYLQTWKPVLIEVSVGEYCQFKQRFLFSNFHLWEAKI